MTSHTLTSHSAVAARRNRPGLLGVIARDLLLINSWVIILLLFTVLSAVAVIYSTHKTRLLTAEVEKLETQKENLELEWRTLRLEQSALAEHNRVEYIATQELNMKRIGKTDEVVIKP